MDVERSLVDDLTEAARFGASAAGGISRLAWTPELAEVTAWVAEELERLGLETEEDPAGNLIARWPGPTGPAACHEWTETADCELGARVLAGTLRCLAGPGEAGR